MTRYEGAAPPQTPASAGWPRPLTPVLAIVGLALLASAATAASASVSIRNLAFQPQSVTVNVGDSVTWTNNDASFTHTATATNGAWDTGFLDQGQSKTILMSTAGTFAYRCRVHPSMTGTVVVVGAATPAPTAPPAPTPVPTPAPPTIAPPTIAPPAETPRATATPTSAPSPTPTSAPTATPTASASTTASAVAVAVQAPPSPSTSALAPAASRPDDAPWVGLIVVGVLALAGVAGLGLYLARRA